MSRKVQTKTPQQVSLMRAAGLVVADALDAVRAAAAPGVTTGELDAVAHEVITRAGATASFLGYHGFPGSICASIDAEVVHGIPSPDRPLPAGCLLSVDCGAVLDGWHGDAAITLVVGEVPPAWRRLVEETERALWAGLASARPGARLDEVGGAIETVTRAAGLGTLTGYSGHGIGTAMHMAPDVDNVAGGRHGRLRLAAGMIIAVEPMTTLGSPDTVELADGWTVVTVDGQPGAHWEHTVAITPTGPWVLTARDGGRARLGAGVSALAATT